MKIDLITNTFDRKIYDAKASHPLQSWEWGEARKKMGMEVVRLGEFNGSRLMEPYQMTIHPIPYTSYRLGYLPRSRFPSKAVLQFLTEYARKHQLIFVKFEPNEHISTPYSTDTFPVVKSTHQLFPDWTMMLDLSQSEDELLHGMKQKTRYNIRLAERKGVRIKEESDEKGFETFIKLYLETCRRQKYFGHNKHYHRTIWNSLRGSIAHILIASYQNNPVAAYELFYFNTVLYYPYGGTSDLHRNVMGANLIMWEAIRFGKKLGATKFDMWGSAPETYTNNHTYAGFTRFKEGYGAKFYQMVGSFDLITNPALYSLYNNLYKLRTWYLTVRAHLAG